MGTTMPLVPLPPPRPPAQQQHPPLPSSTQVRLPLLVVVTTKPPRCLNSYGRESHNTYRSNSNNSHSNTRQRIRQPKSIPQLFQDRTWLRGVVREWPQGGERCSILDCIIIIDNFWHRMRPMYEPSYKRFCGYSTLLCRRYQPMWIAVPVSNRHYHHSPKASYGRTESFSEKCSNTPMIPICCTAGQLPRSNP